MKLIGSIPIICLLILPTLGIAADTLSIEKQPLSDFKTVYDDLKEFMKLRDGETQEEREDRVQEYIEESPVRFFETADYAFKWFYNTNTQEIEFYFPVDEHSSLTDISISSSSPYYFYKIYLSLDQIGIEQTQHPSPEFPDSVVYSLFTDILDSNTMEGLIPNLKMRVGIKCNNTSMDIMNWDDNMTVWNWLHGPMKSITLYDKRDNSVYMQVHVFESDDPVWDYEPPDNSGGDDTTGCFIEFLR